MLTVIVVALALQVGAMPAGPEPRRPEDDVVNARDDGARGTGSPADAAANDRAFAAAVARARNGRFVGVPAGWYAISETVTLGEYAAGLVGLGGPVVLVWHGPSDGRPMVRMRATHQTLIDVRLVGSERRASICVQSVAGAEGRQQKARFIRAWVEQCDVGVQVESGVAQAEQFYFDSCMIAGNRIGVRTRNGNSDYWVLVNTYFANNLEAGLEADAPGPSSATLIGVVFTGGEAGIRIRNGMHQNSITLVNCQSENTRVQLDLRAPAAINVIGGTLASLSIAGGGGVELTTEGATIASGAQAHPFHIPRDHSSHVFWTSRNDRFLVNGQPGSYGDAKPFLVDGGGDLHVDADGRYGHVTDKSLKVKPDFPWSPDPSLEVWPARREGSALTVKNSAGEPLLDVTDGGIGLHGRAPVARVMPSGAPVRTEIVPGEGWVSKSHPQAWLWKDELGMIHLSGRMERGTASPSSVLGTVPVGARPADELWFAVWIRGGPTALGVLQVRPDGALAVFQQDGVTPATECSLDGVTYYAQR